MILDPADRFEVDFEYVDGTALLAVEEVRWRDGGVLLIGTARKRLKRGGFGVPREGSFCDLGPGGMDRLTDEQRALVMRAREG